MEDEDQKPLQEYRTLLVNIEQKSQEDYDKAMLTSNKKQGVFYGKN